MHNCTYVTTRYPAHSSFVPGSDGGGHLPGEQALWRAVLTQALMDISSNSKKLADKMERARALAWFSLMNPDFIAVCSLADLEPKYVLQKVKEALGRGCQWRKDRKHRKKKEKGQWEILPHANLVGKPSQGKAQPPETVSITGGSL